MKNKVFLFLLLLIFSDIFSQQAVIKLNEGFENSQFPPAGWRRINPQGANTWQRLVAPMPAEIMQPPVQGNSVARIDYEPAGGEDWLITKRVSGINTGDSLLFYVIKQYPQGPYPPDSLIIKISTTDSAINSFNTMLLNINIAGIPTGNQVWHKFKIGLSQFSGQDIFIAFQHKDFNGHGCAIDSIVVYNINSIGIHNLGSNVPEKCNLYQNYPNPFNPSTKIRFSVSNDNSLVTLKIFDVLGNEITELVNGKLNRGIYEADFNINNLKYRLLSSGFYFYKLSVSEKKNILVFTKSMILIK